MMEDLPEDVVTEILVFLPRKSFLPVANVSKCFYRAWKTLKNKKNKGGFERDGEEKTKMPAALQSSSTKDEQHCCWTDPFELGNLFQTPWYDDTIANRSISTSMLSYYIVECGWWKEEHEPTNQKNKLSLSLLLIREVISRGDIHAMEYIRERGWYDFQDKDCCEIAAAAGRLTALQWLHETIHCPWDINTVHREAMDSCDIPTILYLTRQITILHNKNRRTITEKNGNNTKDEEEEEEE
uniref:F-box domain-containing protein n=1 Tax=Cyclophora tenuis TaxID=216820 RepID=A0A7S1GQ01_CYCTE